MSEGYNKQTHVNAKVCAVNSLGTDFDLLLTRGALCVLLVAGAWSVLVVVAVAAEARTRGRVRIAERSGCPAAVRLWLLGVFVAVFAAATPAHASDAGSGPGITAAVDGLPLPDRATDDPARARVPRGRVVTVHSGDSLWRIARRLLPAAAPDSAVAAAVSALYADNRHTIGPDPDALLAGQRLVVDAVSSFPDPTTLLEER